MCDGLNSFAGNVYSQFGEDGILEELFRRLPAVTGRSAYCVEFGAWDGTYLSNCANFILSSQWSALLIEGDRQRGKTLSKTFSDRPDVATMTAMVGLNAGSQLDDLLSRVNAPDDFELLSIDVDGMDYWIFDSLHRFCPKVVVIEFNPTLGSRARYIQAPNPRFNQGSSAAAIADLAESKGYQAVAATHCNLIFVREDLLEFALPMKPALEAIVDSSSQPVIGIGYDGSILSTSPYQLPWHGVVVDFAHLRVLPRTFLQYPANFNQARRVLWRLWRLWMRLRPSPKRPHGRATSDS